MFLVPCVLQRKGFDQGFPQHPSESQPFVTNPINGLKRQYVILTVM
jgi:hypothetical protein